MRKLIHVPMFHSNGEIVAGLKLPPALEIPVKNFWNIVNEDLTKLELDPSKIKLYLEGIPQGQFYIPTKVADTPYSRITRRLVSQGAKVVGVENKEIFLASGIIGEGIKVLLENEKETYDFYSRLHEIILMQIENSRLRDIAVAEGIMQDLKDNDIGILFMGADHSPQQHLSDVIVEPISERVTECTQEIIAIGSTKEAALEMIREKRDSFLPQNRGPERQ